MMIHPKDFYISIFLTIWNKKGCAVNQQLSGSFNSPWSPNTRLLRQQFNSFNDSQDNPYCRSWIFPGKICFNLFKVSGNEL